MDAESSESGEILSAGFHDGHAPLVVSTAGAGLFVVVVGSCSNACRFATQKGAGGIDVMCVIDGGRFDINKILWMLMFTSGTG